MVLKVSRIELGLSDPLEVGSDKWYARITFEGSVKEVQELCRKGVNYSKMVFNSIGLSHMVVQMHGTRAEMNLAIESVLSEYDTDNTMAFDLTPCSDN